MLFTTLKKEAFFLVQRVKKNGLLTGYKRLPTTLDFYQEKSISNNYFISSETSLSVVIALHILRNGLLRVKFTII